MKIYFAGHKNLINFIVEFKFIIMEKIVFLLAPDPQNLIEILKNIACDLGFLAVLYKWSLNIKMHIFDTSQSKHTSRFQRSVSQTIQLFQSLSIKNNRIVLLHYFQNRMVLAVDNFFDE